MPPLILLPPSEKKAPGGVGVPWHEAGQSFAGLDDARREVVAALDDAMDAPLEARAKLLGVGAANVDRATIANRRVDTAPTLPAIVRYTGVLYDALDAESLPPDCESGSTNRSSFSRGCGVPSGPRIRSPTTS